MVSHLNPVIKTRFGILDLNLVSSITRNPEVDTSRDFFIFISISGQRDRIQTSVNEEEFNDIYTKWRNLYNAKIEQMLEGFE